MLIDSHCHIHSKDYGLDPEKVLQDSQEQGIQSFICVGTDIEDSRLAIDFASKHADCYPTIGLHPHDAKLGEKAYRELADLAKSQSYVAIGECGLDYYYEYSTKQQQKEAFRFQLDLAAKHQKPMIFHVREAFADFFEIVDEYPGIIGVVHSFTADESILAEVLKRGFYIGLNGIMTFTKDNKQLLAAKKVPLDKLLLETDSPYLTPSPYRGKINTPAYVRLVGEFLAELRGEPLAKLSEISCNNSKSLFNL